MLINPSVNLYEVDDTYTYPYLQQFCTHRNNSYVYGFFYNNSKVWVTEFKASNIFSSGGLNENE